MYTYSRAVLFGIFLWVVPFVVVFLCYPLREQGSALFVTIRTVTIVLAAVIFTIIYFRGAEGRPIVDGAIAGLIWFVVSMVIDIGPYVVGHMKMSFTEYLLDTGLNYLTYPIVTIGAGVLLALDRAETAAAAETPTAPSNAGESGSKGETSSKEKVVS